MPASGHSGSFGEAPRGRSSSGRLPAAGVGDGVAWRNWGYESAALDLALAEADAPLHEAIGLDPRPVTFVNSLGLASPPSVDTIVRRLERCPGLRFKLDAAPTGRRDRRRAGGHRGRHTIDFKGRYGLEVEDDAALAAMYELLLAAFPDALSRTRTTCRRSPRSSRRTPPRLLRRADPHCGRPRRAVAARADDQRQALPGRHVARPVRALRRLRGARAGALRGRDGRARRGPRSGPAAGLAVPSRWPERHRPTRIQRARPRPRPRRSPLRRSPSRPGSGANRTLDPVSIHRYRLPMYHPVRYQYASSATCANGSRSCRTLPQRPGAPATRQRERAGASCCASTRPLLGPGRPPRARAAPSSAVYAARGTGASWPGRAVRGPARRT